MRRRGFTLIELLVVIAIIAILAAILFPVFAQARDRARQITCTSDVRQIATGLHMYAQDYDEVLPSWPFQNPGMFSDPRFATWSYSMWVDAMMPYVKNGGVFGCPNGPQTAAYRRGPAGAQIYVHLAFNEYIMNSAHNWSSLAALSNTPGGPASVAIISESVFPGIFQDWDDGNTQVKNKPAGFGLYRLYCANGVGNSGATCLPRHTDHGVNVAYADGHAKFVSGGRIMGGAGTPKESPIVNPAKQDWFQ
jgi:prepilin-type N-terminal cleavage/methylation domain-containing protein/prepilin-type processing-associated H-X9-DG protein